MISLISADRQSKRHTCRNPQFSRLDWCCKQDREEKCEAHHLNQSGSRSYWWNGEAHFDSVPDLGPRGIRGGGARTGTSLGQ